MDEKEASHIKCFSDGAKRASNYRSAGRAEILIRTLRGQPIYVSFRRIFAPTMALARFFRRLLFILTVIERSALLLAAALVLLGLLPVIILAAIFLLFRENRLCRKIYLKINREVGALICFDRGEKIPVNEQISRTKSLAEEKSAIFILSSLGVQMPCRIAGVSVGGASLFFYLKRCEKRGEIKLWVIY